MESISIVDKFWLPCYKKSFNLYNLWIKFICVESGLAFLIVDPNVWSDFSRTTLVILKTPRNNLYRVWINSAFVCAPIGSLLCWTLIKLPNPPNKFFKSIVYIDIEYTHCIGIYSTLYFSYIDIEPVLVTCRDGKLLRWCA